MDISDNPSVTQPKTKHDLTITEVDGELLVLNDTVGEVHQLNASAAIVFRNCDGQTSIKAMVQLLCSEFDITPEVAAVDIEQTLHTFRSKQLLVD